MDYAAGAQALAPVQQIASVGGKKKAENDAEESTATGFNGGA